MANTTATASIADDDGAAGTPSSWVSTCVGPQVSAVVGDVFDVVQSGQSQWTDVFVDVELSCESGSGGVGGYRTAVEVVSGPGKGRRGGWHDRLAGTMAVMAARRSPQRPRATRNAATDLMSVRWRAFMDRASASEPSLAVPSEGDSPKQSASDE